MRVLKRFQAVTSRVHVLHQFENWSGHVSSDYDPHAHPEPLQLEDIYDQYHEDHESDEHVVSAEVSEEVARRINSGVRLEERLRLRREGTKTLSHVKRVDVEKTLEGLVTCIEKE